MSPNDEFRSNIVNVIGGSSANFVSAGHIGATIGGGGAGHYFGHASINRVRGDFGTVGGGSDNTSSSAYATVGGGYGNTSSGYSATVPGGFLNLAEGGASFAAGYRAKALHDGSFVWADSQNADFTSTSDNEFSIRATGGVRLSDSTPDISFGAATRQMLNLWGTQYGIGVQSSTVYFRTDNASGLENGFAWYKGGTHTNALQNAGGGATMMRLDGTGLYVNGTFVSSSDRNVKQDFVQVNTRAVLEKLVQLPIQTWAYKNNPATKHLGPMAQDFYRAFAVGPDDKHIATVDADGVALAAIQGLNQKVEEKNAEIRNLRVWLEKLEQLLTRQLEASERK